MRNTTAIPAVLAAAIGAVLLSGATLAHATELCCPNDGNGKPLRATSGLGEQFPVAQNLSADTSWNVYEFERDGLRYLQINDSFGGLRALVGRAGNTFFVVPGGSDLNRVSIGSVPAGAAPGSTGILVYRGADVEVQHYLSLEGDAWLIKGLGE